MKKLLAISLTLALVLALATTSSAAITGWTPDNADWYTRNSAGDLIIDGANNTGMALDQVITGDYTIELEVNVPKTPEATDCKFVISVGCTDTSWLSGMWFRFLRSTDGTVGTAYFNDGTDNYAEYACDTAPAYNLGDNDFNTMKIVRANGNYTFYFNDTLVFTKNPKVNTGNNIVIGANFSSASAVDFPAITVRNFSITTGGTTVTYFNGPTPGPADMEVVAIAGAMVVSLLAAAFVVKARKA